MELKAITFLAKEMIRLVSLHDELQELAQGVDQLIYGHLSPKLVNTTQLRGIIADINNQLAKEGKRLCYSTPREVFMSKNFEVARAQTDLIVRLRMPYARSKSVDVYKTIFLSMVVPGKQGFITQLQGFPRYIVGDPTVHVWGELPAIPTSEVIDDFEIKWTSIISSHAHSPSSWTKQK
jgi:hypothetical protein